MRFIPLILGVSLILSLSMANSCKRSEKFPNLGLSIAGPIDVAVSDNGSYFYVLNSDFDRTYNKGSVLVMDTEGNKLTAVEVPRLGRSLEVAGSDMLVTIDKENDEDKSSDTHLLLFDVTDPTTPVLKKDFLLNCGGPINTAMRKNYKYFALTCSDGSLFVGTLADDRSNSTLKKVRNYAKTRRALLLDDKRGLIMGFTTEFGLQQSKDIFLQDTESYDSTTYLKVLDASGNSVPNEIPDVKEETKSVSANKGSRRTYQFFVYDINAGAKEVDNCTPSDTDDCTFPYYEVPDTKIDAEQRWIYFNLSNVDGTPDPDGNKFGQNSSFKYYRTNFWDAKPDPTDANVFYLSHRGPPTDKGSPHANQVVKVTIIGDLRPSTKGVAPHTEDVMSFERVYGFKGSEVSKLHYPGDIEVAQVQGQKVLIVNNFRDLDSWARGDVYFSVAAKMLDDSAWTTETEENSNPRVSWFQIAVNPEGRAISGSFYGNKVMLLDVTPGLDIREYKRVE